MRIFVINLARAKDRLSRMVEQLSHFNLVFERIEATDGQKITASQRALVDDEKRKRITPYPLSDNEIGCWLSHRTALQYIADGNDEMGLVLEDDAELSQDFPHLLHSLDIERDPFDFLFLHRKFKSGELFIATSDVMEGLREGYVGPAHMGAIGYIVSKKAAKKFLRYAPKFVHAIDKEIHRYWANGLIIKGLERPLIAHVDEGLSFIEETRAQEKPESRRRYKNADRLDARFIRLLTRWQESFAKRKAWQKLSTQRGVL